MPVRTIGARISRGFVEWMMLRDLRRTFRRVVWVGPRPWETGEISPDRPLVIYANHHYFQDGYLLWLLCRRVLDRPLILWMRDWDRTPLFGPLGALPFPEEDAARRRATIRETHRRLRDQPNMTFVYFPEGELGSPDAGVAPFDPERMTRLARALPRNALWWPVALRLTWWGDDRPTALLAGGQPHRQPDGHERDRLVALLDTLSDARPGDSGGHQILEGRSSPHERWNLTSLAPLFRRWT
jgi:hypothetical protein